MADGFYDYKTGVPATYYNALRAWINKPPASILGGLVLREKKLKFSAYGTTTNKPANAITFYINFQGNFGITIQEAPLNVAPKNIA